MTENYTLSHAYQICMYSQHKVYESTTFQPFTEQFVD